HTVRHPGRGHLAVHRGPIAVSAVVLVRCLTAVVLAPAAGWITPLTHGIGQVVPSFGVRVDDRQHGSMFHAAPVYEQGETVHRRGDAVIVTRTGAAPDTLFSATTVRSTPTHAATVGRPRSAGK